MRAREEGTEAAAAAATRGGHETIPNGIEDFGNLSNLSRGPILLILTLLATKTYPLNTTHMSSHQPHRVNQIQENEREFLNEEQLN